jgi:hypothetical protein
MEKLVEDSGIEELFSDETVVDKVTRGIPQLEAEEMVNAQASYPRIPQRLYPKERSDNIPGQHYNHYNIEGGFTTSWVLLCTLEDLFFSFPEMLLKPQTKRCSGVTTSWYMQKQHFL